LLARVSAFVAPVAADAGSVIKEPADLDVADALYEAFGDLDADGGLSRAELAAACGSQKAAAGKCRPGGRSCQEQHSG
jgi:hypothetical protein